MLNKIIEFSIRNKLIVGLLLIGLIGYGVFNLTKLPIDAVPDITNNQVMVMTTSPTLGAGDVERLITFPIEQATRNIPGIIEQRSFSRFGLSLVTIVFNDQTDVYWARQQVSEKLRKVQIPPTLGVPELDPVTTGLGEIFQYVIRPKRGYEQKFDVKELRTIQDWVVRRQLLGTPGVADVSSFGGELKQYEVAIDDNKLKLNRVTIQDVFSALEKNNQNTGGAYIEKGPNILYIRSEGLIKNEKQIASVMIKSLPNGTPLLIKDVAEVRIGSAIRYGAICYNDQGEVAGGLVMMLKGENSSQVIKDVKEKIHQIEKTLPEGVLIEPFLDRTKMVNNAIHTVEKNLMEGALIVIFVLVLFLGNIRAGLLVASVIPLAMLFAVIMMNWFGVSGNLMSLGALDFGLIIDGAVIVVEAVMHRLHHHQSLSGIIKIDQKKMDEEVKYSAGKMMNAAVFGQIIILIVYLPILSLQGIEGKMFKPMAQTVAFAIIGAFILSLTYIPMMSSLVLSKKISNKKSWSDRLMEKLENGYQLLLKKTMAIPKALISVAVVCFVISVVLLMNMGGEFIPKLEEGDFAVDTRVLTGSSLTTTIKASQQAAHVLKTNFPEVEKIVTKIGSGEIPTDPMPVEACDMMVILKPKAEWVSASSFDELAGKMSGALEDVPGITVGFQYPVQMRFNELMTGGRQDVVCKIFGENLDTLAYYAEKLGGIVSTIDGAVDPYVESVTGLPQIVIEYNREALAQYGLSVDDVNKTIQAAFAGAVSGQIFEQERRFDLVVRLGHESRKDLSDIQNLLISTSSGQQIPLYEVADAQIKIGPNQIQREDAQRRITVGFNVRGKDVQSVVSELEQKVKAQIHLPSGNYITYGGAFENLVQAKKRLSIAVPVSLLLIFVLLFFAFASVRQGLLIYSAIPLSAIGGVLALWLRGMPFSISAGVGFIALFGVAVLNGIVLITEFNDLKKSGIQDVKERILSGTKTRLRPVLMTAFVASLGFLPMAISNGAGAEVQRPLATVVIGGLITATLLTLLVLPVLYEWNERKQHDQKKMKINSSVPVIIIFLFLSFSFYSQQPISLKAALDSASKQNLSVQAAIIQSQVQKKLEKTAWDLPYTNISGDYGQFNSAQMDNRIAVSQSMQFPLVYVKQKQLLRAQTQGSLYNEEIIRQEVKKQIAMLYYDMILLTEKRKILYHTDSLYLDFQNRQQERFNAGDANLLEKATAETQRMQIANQLNQLEADLKIIQLQFSRLMNSKQMYLPETSDLKWNFQVSADTASVQHFAFVKWKQQQSLIANQEWKLEKAKMLPTINMGYNNQSVIGYQIVNNQDVYFDVNKRFSYVSFGLNAPLFFRSGKNRISSSKLNYLKTEKEVNEISNQYKTMLMQLLLKLDKNKETISYYENGALKQADIILKNANLQFKNGSINYIEWIMLINQAISIRSEFLNTLQEYNQTIIDINYLTNQL